jgi:hypothetical protein
VVIKTGIQHATLVAPELLEVLVGAELKRRKGDCERELALSINETLGSRLSDGRVYIVQMGPLEWGQSWVRRELTVLLQDWRDAKIGEAAVGEPYWAGTHPDVTKRTETEHTECVAYGRVEKRTFVREYGYWRRS